MNPRSLVKLITLLALIVWFASPVSAQPRFRRFKRQQKMIRPTSSIGLRLGNDFKHDQYLTGAHFQLPVGFFWQFMPGADYYFTGSDSKRWQFNGDLVFKPHPAGPLYFGGGVAVHYLTKDDQTNVGGNLLVGLEFGGMRKPVMYPFIQARWTFLDKREYFSLLGGINFILR